MIDARSPSHADSAPVANRSGDCRFDRFTLQPAQRRLLRDGEPVELEAKVFDLILLLLENRDRALAKQETIEALWGHRPVTDTALSQLVYKARRALDDDGERQAVIRTVYGHGLQWIAALTPAAEPVATTNRTDIAQGTEPSRPPRARRQQRAWLLLAALAAAIPLALWLVPGAKAPPGLAMPRLAVLPLDNASGDKALDWTRAGLPGLLSSLLSETGDISVVDPQRVARVWDYRVPNRVDHIDHVRFVTNADIVVGMHLAKLADRVYELRLHLSSTQPRRNKELVLDGDNPALLAANAVSRLRRMLALAPTPTELSNSRQQGYMAESFARGLDLGSHGDWGAAKPYFRVVADSEPDFLAARLYLGKAQSNTDQLDAAKTTLHDTLARAETAGESALAANALLQLANLDMLHHQWEAALARLKRASVLAQAKGSLDLHLSIALKALAVAAALHQPKIAAGLLQEAKALVADHPLPDRVGDIANAELSLAEARGDATATERAGRAALAASQAVGNDANALIDTYNLALALQHQQRPFEALPMFASAWQRSQRLHWAQLIFGSGDNLAIGLLDSGDAPSAERIAVQLETLGTRQGNTAWRALALMLRAGAAWYSGDAHAALALCRQADALIGDQDPALRINLWLEMAPAMLVVEPTALPALAKRAVALSVAQPDGQGFRYERDLLQALAASAEGNTQAALASLKAARVHPPIYDAALANLRSSGLAIALHANDPRAAAIALDGFDIGTATSADLLRLTAEWADRQGDQQRLARAQARRQQLGTLAHKALADAGMDLPGLLLAPATAGSAHSANE